MHAALLSFLLVAGAPHGAAAAEADGETVVTCGRHVSGADCPASSSDHCGSACALWQFTRGVAIPAHASHAPGTFPNPTGNCWKHAYLAYRGNFYLGGYDYRREFDYPWHKPRCCSPSPLTASARPSRNEEIPSPAPTPANAKRGAIRAGSASTAGQAARPQ